jgi:DNA-directed RNA polymerase specialized sigma24 family protein
MHPAQEFHDVIAKFRGGDQLAAAEIYRRFVLRLTALATTQFESGLRPRADPEGVVQSVYRSFFRRDLKTPYELDGWEGLWRLLAVITVRKCSKKRHKPGELPWLADHGVEALDRQPTPAEASALSELIARIFAMVGPEDRKKVELILQGFTAVEISELCGCCERTVRRLRDHLREEVSRMLSEQEDE